MDKKYENLKATIPPDLVLRNERRDVVYSQSVIYFKCLFKHYADINTVGEIGAINRYININFSGELPEKVKQTIEQLILQKGKFMIKNENNTFALSVAPEDLRLFPRGRIAKNPAPIMLDIPVSSIMPNEVKPGAFHQPSNTNQIIMNSADANSSVNSEKNISVEDEVRASLDQFRQNVRTELKKLKHGVIAVQPNYLKRSISINARTEDSAKLIYKDFTENADLKLSFPFVEKNGIKTITLFQFAKPGTQSSPEEKSSEKESGKLNASTDTGADKKPVRRTLSYIQKHTLQFLKAEGFVYKNDYLTAKAHRKGGFVSLNCSSAETFKNIKERMLAKNTEFPYFVESREGTTTVRISTKKSLVKNHKTPATKKTVSVPKVNAEPSEYVPTLKKLIDHLSKPLPVPEMPNMEKLLKEALVKGFNKLLTSAGNNAEMLIRTRDGSSESTVKVSKTEFLKAFEG